MTSNFASRFSGVPALVAVGHEGWLEGQINSLDAAIAKAAADPETVRQFRDESAEAAGADEKFWGEDGSFMSMLRPYTVKDGVLHVPVAGMLMHDFPYAAFGMATGYEYIVKAVERGVADPDVSSIALVINSGGGTVAGCFDAVDRIYNARGAKPIVATVNEHAYSAAYAIASAADKITLPRAGGVGSVGVVTSHVDESEALSKAGLKVTFIHAGAHKVDGNATEPLSDAVRDRIQTRIDGLYDIFVSTVSRNLGIEEGAVRDTEAQTYSANEAVSLGFAHEVRAHDEALAGLSVQFTNVGETAMSQPNQEAQAATTAASAESAEVSRESLDAARAEGRTEGAQAERERIQGILNSEEAAGRDGLANHFAMNTDMSIESAVAALAASPKADAAPAAQTPGASFESAMSRGNPEISPEGGDGEQASEASDVDSILASFGQASGYSAKH